MILQMVEAIEQQGPLSPRIACLSSKNFLNNVKKNHEGERDYWLNMCIHIFYTSCWTDIENKCTYTCVRDRKYLIVI